jgi:hypothetical protein
VSVTGAVEVGAGAVVVVGVVVVGVVVVGVVVVVVPASSYAPMSITDATGLELGADARTCSGGCSVATLSGVGNA